MSWYEPSPQQIGIRALDLKDVGGEVQGGDVWPHKQLCIVAHKKKKALLVQDGLERALEGKAALALTMLDAKKRSILVKTLSVIQLSLSNKVL